MNSPPPPPSSSLSVCPSVRPSFYLSFGIIRRVNLNNVITFSLIEFGGVIEFMLICCNLVYLFSARVVSPSEFHAPITTVK